ncbi:SIS domain-containing protein [bacterium]|nr:SIS domain-containing protein [bacterium]
MTNHQEKIQQYLTAFKTVIDNFPVQDLLAILEKIEAARESGATVFTCGNGGSWATASHMVCDFAKNTRMPDQKRLRMIGLGDNIPALTAYANDEDYSEIFAEPALGLIRKDDVLIAISASGNSPNVLKAVEVAKQAGAITLGLTGFDGGELAKMVDHVLVVPSDKIEMVEDFHLIADHLLTICLRG